VNRKCAYGLQRISENQLVGSTWTPSFYGYDGHGNVRFLETWDALEKLERENPSSNGQTFS